MEPNIEVQLKQLIKEKYKDMKAFSNIADIPNTTLHSMFKRGILNSTVSNVIQISKVLGISVDALAEGRIEYRHSSPDLIKDRDNQGIEELRELYNSLNDSGQKQLILQAKQIANYEEYQKVETKGKAM